MMSVESQLLSTRTGDYLAEKPSEQKLKKLNKRRPITPGDPGDYETVESVRPSAAASGSV